MSNASTPWILKFNGMNWKEIIWDSSLFKNICIKELYETQHELTKAKA
jgi:hypothetical protein